MSRAEVEVSTERDRLLIGVDRRLISVAEADAEYVRPEDEQLLEAVGRSSEA